MDKEQVKRNGKMLLKHSRIDLTLLSVGTERRKSNKHLIKKGRLAINFLSHLPWTMHGPESLLRLSVLGRGKSK